MDADKIMRGVAAAWDLVFHATCECGGHYGFLSQALTYSEADKCMVDEMNMECMKCGKEKKFTIPQHHMNPPHCTERQKS